MAGPSTRYRDALRSRDLRLMLAAFTIDESGSWAYAVVVSAYIFGRTGSPGWVAAIMAVRWITGMLASGPAGVIADRVERRRVVQAGALAAAVVTGVLAVLVEVDAPLWTLLVASGLIALVSSVNRPASGSMVPDVVGERDLAAANALFATLENVVVVLGPALGGLLLLVGDPSIGIAFNAASYLVSAVLFGVVGTTSRGESEPGKGMIEQFADGWRILVGHRVAFVLVLLLVLDSAVFGAMSVVFGPLSLFVGTGVNGYSYLIGLQAVGGVIGAVIGDRVAARSRLAPVIMVAFLIECVPLAFCTVTRSPIAAGGLQVFFGVGMVIIDVVGITAMQRDLPREALGRANALLNGMVAGATAAASFIVTALLASAGLTVTVVAIGVGFPLLALAGIGPVVRNDREVAARMGELNRRVDLLTDLDLFAGASRPVLEQLAQSGHEFTLPAGAGLVRQGDPADALWLLEQGELGVVVDTDHGPDVRPDIVAPAYIGEIGLLHRIPRTASVQAKSDCTLLRIRADDFFAALDTANASRSMLAIAGQRFGRADRTRPRPSPVPR